MMKEDEAFPDYFPEEFFLKGEELDHSYEGLEDLMYPFELMGKIYALLDQVERFLSDDPKEGLDFFESSSWTIIKGSLYGLCKKNKRLMVQLMPKSFWTILPEMYFEFSRDIDDQQQERIQFEELLNSSIKQFRLMLVDLFRADISFTGEIPFFNQLQEVHIDGSIDEKCLNLTQIASVFYEKSSLKYKEWIRSLDLVFQDQSFLRFHLWNHIQAFVRWDHESYPLYSLSYVPSRSEEVHISTIYFFVDVLQLFAEYVLCKDPNKLDLLKSFFPTEFFLSVDRYLLWSSLEEYVCAGIEEKDLLVLLTKFLELFIEEDEDCAYINVEIFMHVNESACRYSSEENLDGDQSP